MSKDEARKALKDMRRAMKIIRENCRQKDFDVDDNVCIMCSLGKSPIRCGAMDLIEATKGACPDDWDV